MICPLKYYATHQMTKVTSLKRSSLLYLLVNDSHSAFSWAKDAQYAAEIMKFKGALTSVWLT